VVVLDVEAGEARRDSYPPPPSLSASRARNKPDDFAILLARYVLSDERDVHTRSRSLDLRCAYWRLWGDEWWGGDPSLAALSQPVFHVESGMLVF
jgi:hypothetical protein